tara:strand:- start:154 stop:753 length:600 start_codon:yes stop_codon:yes gene_type:complete
MEIIYKSPILRKMVIMKLLRLTTILIISIILASCQLAKLGGDARKNPPDPRERVKRNLEEGKGFRLNNMIKKDGGGNFEFASSNELWRASLDTIDFIPLASVNYSGGIIITDWYSSDKNSNEVLKISIRFLTNEIRSDALDIKIFTKTCDNQNNCVTSEKSGNLIAELKREILKKAVKYEKENPNKKKEPYVMSTPGDG